MITKSIEKTKAIALRREGKTYSEIMKVVPVAKSTISLWLREVGLSVPQQQVLTAKKIAASKRGGLAKRKQRIHRTSAIFEEAKAEIGTLSKRELFLIGVALYWAEGSKQKEHNVSEPLVFGNSDPNMIECFLRWLNLVGVQDLDVCYELYIHKSGNVERAKQFWVKIIKQPVWIFDKRVYFKKGNPKTKRKNSGEKYIGLLRVKVKRSTDLNRKILGWTHGIIKNCI